MLELWVLMSLISSDGIEIRGIAQLVLFCRQIASLLSAVLQEHPHKAENLLKPIGNWLAAGVQESKDKVDCLHILNLR